MYRLRSSDVVARPNDARGAIEGGESPLTLLFHLRHSFADIYDSRLLIEPMIPDGIGIRQCDNESGRTWLRRGGA
jgi:hypothetical protein